MRRVDPRRDRDLRPVAHPAAEGVESRLVLGTRQLLDHLDDTAGGVDPRQPHHRLLLPAQLDELDVLDARVASELAAADLGDRAPPPGSARSAERPHHGARPTPALPGRRAAPARRSPVPMPRAR
jgi:hypothetical protein